MSETCAVCKKIKETKICKVCGFSGDVSINKDVKPYRKKWKTKTREAKLWAQEMEKKYDIFIDPRDGKAYKTIEINGQVWMAENLAYTIGGRYYKDEPAYGKKYRLLYKWEDAIKACPKGWHLPSLEEWQSLAYMGNRFWYCKSLMAKIGWADCEGTDDYGFAALPGGHGRYKGYSDYEFFHDYEGGYWWTSSERSAYKAYYWYIWSSGRGYKKHCYKNSLFSVRCVRD